MRIWLLILLFSFYLVGGHQTQPLLSHLDRTPVIHSIQQTEEENRRETPVSQVNTITEHSEPNVSQIETQRAGTTASPLKYTYLQKLPHQNHIEELNFRLRSLEEHVEIVSPQPSTSQEIQPTFGSDINPSVGDISDRESELNIRQLESSVSSINGANSGSANAESIYSSPVSRREKPDRAEFRAQETDF